MTTIYRVEARNNRLTSADIQRMRAENELNGCTYVGLREMLYRTVDELASRDEAEACATRLTVASAALGFDRPTTYSVTEVML